MKIVRRFTLFIFLCLIQISLYIAVIEAGYSYRAQTEQGIRPDINWGLTTWLSYYVFAVLSIISASFHGFKSNYRWLPTAILILLFCWFYWSPHYPYRAALLILSCFIGLTLPPFVLEVVRHYKRKRSTSETLPDDDTPSNHAR